jgi:hypothetical protein
MSHAGGHLREAFHDYTETGSVPPDTEHNGEQLTIVSLMAALWYCTDAMPSAFCEMYDLPPGFTYAEAVQELYRQRQEAMWAAERN